MQSPVLLAYANRFSVAPSETLRVMVSAATATYRARLVRLVHGDTNPAGPGYREVAVPSAADGAYPGRQQTSTAGSCVRVPLRTPLDPSDGLTVQAWVWPTTPDKPGGQSLLACAASGFDFGLDDEGRLRLGLGGVWVGATEPLPRRRWAFVAVTFDGATATLHQASAEPYTARTLVVSEAPLHGAAHLAEELVIGRGFNGKIDRPRLFGRALSDAELEGLAGDGTVARDALADWDFAADISSMRITDHSPNSLHGETFNMPTRAVTDHTWRGDELRWTGASDQYSAIHFHDDDIDDARWAPDFELTIPPDLRSGVYAMKLEADGGEEYVPFYVRPKRGTASAPMAFLAPTLTYLAYANERLYWNKGYLEKRSLVTPLETEPPDVDRYRTSTASWVCRCMTHTVTAVA